MSSKDAMLEGISIIMTPVLLILVVSLTLAVFNFLEHRGYSNKKRALVALLVGMIAFFQGKIFFL